MAEPKFLALTTTGEGRGREGRRGEIGEGTKGKGREGLRMTGIGQDFGGPLSSRIGTSSNKKRVVVVVP